MKNAKAVYEILERAAIEVAELGGNKLAEALRSEMAMTREFHFFEDNGVISFDCPPMTCTRLQAEEKLEAWLKCEPKLRGTSRIVTLREVTDHPAYGYEPESDPDV
jgi:hypothetical protein